MSLPERLKKKRLELNLTQKQLAKMIDMSQQSIQRIEDGSTKSPRMIVPLANALKCPPNWLLFGDKHSEEDISIIGDIDAWSRDASLKDDDIELPYFEQIELSAGNGALGMEEHQQSKLRFSKTTLKKYNVDPRFAVCAKVNGDSMHPVLPSGSTIGIDTSKTNIIDGKMFAINHDGMLRIKKIYRLPNRGLRLKSFNKEEFPDESYQKSDVEHIKILGQIFWYSVML